MTPGFKEQVNPYEIILNELRGLKTMFTKSRRKCSSTRHTQRREYRRNRRDLFGAQVTNRRQKFFPDKRGDFLLPKIFPHSIDNCFHA